jgi:hypothetical protein
MGGGQGQLENHAKKTADSAAKMVTYLAQIAAAPPEPSTWDA